MAVRPARASARSASAASSGARWLVSEIDTVLQCSSGAGQGGGGQAVGGDLDQRPVGDVGPPRVVVPRLAGQRGAVGGDQGRQRVAPGGGQQAGGGGGGEG